MAGTVEQVDDSYGKKPVDIHRRWLREMELATKEEAKWRERASKIESIYRDDQDRYGHRFNILYANISILAPAIFQGNPKPSVERRFRDNDIVARQASEIIERGLEFMVDQYDFRSIVERAVVDMLLVGRGVIRVRYEPHTGMSEGERVPLQEDGTGGFLDNEQNPIYEGDVVMEEDSFYLQKEGEEEVIYEEVMCEYVPWDDFRISPAKKWEDVRWVAFKKRLTRDELIEQFGDRGKEVKLGHETDTYDSNEEEAQFYLRADVWEIWDKETRRMYIVTEGLDKPLLDVEDPLNLEQFFPMAKPLYSMFSNRSMIPIPEYTLYQDQANELNRITDRIDKLIGALKVRGVYPADLKAEMSNLLAGDDNQLIPTDNYQVLIERGGMGGAISWIPIEQIASVLSGLYQQRTALIQSIYELTGISDIFRGVTDPRETLGSQRLKGSYGNLRLSPRQDLVARFIRDNFRLKAEIMAEQYDAQTLVDMAGPGMDVRLAGSILELLRNEKQRGFRIDVEADSTVAIDKQEEKQDAVEYANAIAGFLQTTVPLVQTGAIPPEALVELLKPVIRPFKLGKNLEDILDKISQQPPMGQEGNQEAANNEAQMQEQQAQDAQNAELANQQNQIKAQELQLDQLGKTQEMSLKRQVESLKDEREKMKIEIDQFRAENDASVDAERLRMDRERLDREAYQDA